MSSEVPRRTERRSVQQPNDAPTCSIAGVPALAEALLIGDSVLPRSCPLRGVACCGGAVPARRGAGPRASFCTGFR